MFVWTTELWIAIGTVGSGLATVAVFITGLIQIRSIRDEGRRSRTLDICDRYDFDPILDHALRELRQAKSDGSLDKDPKALRLQVSTLLNYLDGIAIGIEQGIYIEDLVRDHLEGICKKHVHEYLADDITRRMEVDRRDYSRLVSLIGSWNNRQTRFQGGRMRWRTNR